MLKPFDELRERLLQGGVAPRHVRRYIAELTDHLADLMAEERHSGHSRANAEFIAADRLGDIDHLAQVMIEQRRLRSWSARTPWAVFGLAPIAVLAGAYGAITFLLWFGSRSLGVEVLFDAAGGQILPNWFIVWQEIEKFDRIFLPILIGWGISAIAIRQRMPSVWPAVGLAIAAALGSLKTAFLVSSAPIFSEWARACLGACFLVDTRIPSMMNWSLATNLALGAAPFIIWKLSQARSHSTVGI